jgi:hypothetical protein
MIEKLMTCTLCVSMHVHTCVHVNIEKSNGKEEGFTVNFLLVIVVNFLNVWKPYKTK